MASLPLHREGEGWLEGLEADGRNALEGSGLKGQRRLNSAVCVCVYVCQAISKLGVPSQSLVLLPRSGPRNDGWGQETIKKPWERNADRHPCD